MTSRLLPLLSFRFQSALEGFWQRHPAFMGVALGCACAVPAAAAVMFCLWLNHADIPMSMGIKTLMGMGSVLGGLYLSFAITERVAGNIPYDEQLEMVRQLGNAIVPDGDRICHLRKRLILNTQGAAREAWACEQQLELGTARADGDRRPTRL